MTLLGRSARHVPGRSRGPEVTTGNPESGQITLLTMGFAVLALALILVVASASSIHLERKRLLGLADGAAADAADAIDHTQYYGAELHHGAELPDAVVPLTDESVRSAVEAHLDTAMAASRFEGLSISGATGALDGRTASVTLSAVVRPPLVPWVLVPWSDGFAVRVTSLAQAEG